MSVVSSSTIADSSSSNGTKPSNSIRNMHNDFVSIISRITDTPEDEKKISLEERKLALEERKQQTNEMVFQTMINTQKEMLQMMMEMIKSTKQDKS